MTTTSFSLEIRDDRYELLEQLTVFVCGDKAALNILEADGFRQEFDVDLEDAREVYRAFLRRGAVEPEEEGDEPYFNEEEAYEAAVDARMSRVYDAEPYWAV